MPLPLHEECPHRCQEQLDHHCPDHRLGQSQSQSSAAPSSSNKCEVDSEIIVAEKVLGRRRRRKRVILAAVVVTTTTTTVLLHHHQTKSKKKRLCCKKKKEGGKINHRHLLKRASSKEEEEEEKEEKPAPLSTNILHILKEVSRSLKDRRPLQCQPDDSSFCFCCCVHSPAWYAAYNSFFGPPRYVLV